MKLSDFLQSDAFDKEEKDLIYEEAKRYALGNRKIRRGCISRWKKDRSTWDFIVDLSKQI